MKAVAGSGISERNGKQVTKEKNKSRGLEENYNKKRTVRIFAAGASLLSGIFFIIAFIFSFEPETALFKRGDMMFFAGEMVCLAACLIAVLFCRFLIPENKETASESPLPEENRFDRYYVLDSGAMKAARCFCAGALLIEGAVRIYLLFSGKLSVLPSPVVAVLAVMLFLPLMLYFVPEIASLTAPSYPKVHLVYGLIGVLWFIVNIIHSYFDRSLALSSPYTLFVQIMQLSVMLAIVYEIRMRTDSPAPRLRLAALCIAVILTGGFTLGRIAMLICGKIVSADDVAGIVTAAGFTVYLFARLFYYEED